ncbi:SIS domain-containing protein [Rhodobacteraceae bacterium CCMM004]|nr:SIS domain-containing protein [Rhodobacteraceae bacterium CCMM004]
MANLTTQTDDLNGWATWRELTAQPRIWTDWAGRPELEAARDWYARQAGDEVWFCGAGTSAYIGDIVVAGLEGQGGPRLRSVPTTDLVSRPERYLTGRRPLIVNFGRSGDSAETLGTLDALDVLAPGAPRLNVTCNAEGALATRPAPGPVHRLILPADTHDAGFAMTSSFSTMLLSALAIADRDGGADRLAPLAEELAAALPDMAAAARGMDPAPRLVFLGAGPLAYAAREAALKVMELTAGRVPALWDSTLGFRHGPKSFVLPGTRIVLFRAADPHAARYDDDLADELRRQFPDAATTVLGGSGDIAVPEREADVWRAPLFVAFAQVLGVMWSAALGLDVDDPFAGRGTLTRVVSGVRLHPVGR